MGFLFQLGGAGSRIPSSTPDANEVKTFAKDEEDEAAWRLIRLGDGIMWTSAGIFLIPLVKTLTVDIIPGAIRTWMYLNPAEQQGQKALNDLKAAKTSLTKKSVAYYEAARELNKHLKTLPETYTEKEKLSHASPEEVHKQLEDRELRREMKKQLGDEWTKEYFRLRRLEHAAYLDLKTGYLENANKVTALSKSINSLSEGWVLALKELRIREAEFDLERTPFTEPGKLRVKNSAGGYDGIDDPRDVPNRLHGLQTECRNLVVMLSKAKIEPKTLVTWGIAVPAILGGIGAKIGSNVKQTGRDMVQQRHNMPPEKVEENARSHKEKENVRSAMENGEVAKLAQALAEARGKDPELAAAYEVFRNMILDKEYLLDLQTRVTKRTTLTQRKDAEVEKRLERFEQDKEFAFKVLDSALALAALAEAKSNNPQNIKQTLLSREEQPKVVSAKIQRHIYTNLAESLWPTLPPQTSAPGYTKIEDNDKKLLEMVTNGAKELEKLTGKKVTEAPAPISPATAVSGTGRTPPPAMAP